MRHRRIDREKKSNRLDAQPMSSPPPKAELVVTLVDLGSPSDASAGGVVTICLERIPCAHRIDGCELIDLTTEGTMRRRLSAGRWSLLMQDHGLVQLSRLVSEEELDRNTVRVPALGWCGFLSLEWASRHTDTGELDFEGLSTFGQAWLESA